MYGRIHEDLSTRLTPPSRKRTVFRGAHMLFGKVGNAIGMGFARVECEANGNGLFHLLKPPTR